MRNARACAAGLFALLFAIGAATAVSAEIASKIRPGDLLYVEVYRVPDMSRAYLVGEDGAVRLPYISPVAVGSMSATTPTPKVR